ncbi:hypothetical protein OF83DRAFT_1197755 [Amylostereum chailletii]|nr:hypothetical protein OF83DRAFT_1197755 [Amylostereum chailletii]
MENRFSGPMPPRTFIDEFLSLKFPVAHKLQLRAEDDRHPCASANELIRVIEASNITPRLRYTNPIDLRNATPHEARLLPHIAISSLSNDAVKVSQDTFWDAFLEFIPEDEDPFDDPPPTDNAPRRHQVPFNKDSRKALRRRRRVAFLAYDMFGSRSRTFVFSGLIIGNNARLIRWDRAGAVVTELFDWRTKDSPLAIFLHHFDSLSPTERGLDPTVTIPSPDEISFARAAFQRANIAAEDEDHTMRKFRVRDECTKEERFYLAGPPNVFSPSLAGKATSGYAAVDLADGTCVWLKDTWRLELPHVRKEADVYRLLAGANVPHVAPFVCGGDVEGQKTRSHEFSAHGARAHIHHRVVLGVIGRPLMRFNSTLELTTAVRDALEAHSKAYTDLNILHGDISDHNILLSDDGRGILIDWDLSIDVEREERTSLAGSWQFISASRLESHGKKIHGLSDDLESFVYVLFYHLVRYRPSGVWSIERSLNEIFYPYRPGEEWFHTTYGKTGFLSGGYVSNERLELYLNVNLARLIRQLRCLFYAGVYADDDDIEPCFRSVASERLKSSRFILDLFDTAIAGAGWRSNDGCRDMLKKCEDDKTKSWDVCEKAPMAKRTASAVVEDGGSRSSKRQRCSGPPPTSASKTPSRRLLRTKSGAPHRTGRASIAPRKTSSKRR